jgi:hypothetical protein
MAETVQQLMARVRALGEEKQALQDKLKTVREDLRRQPIFEKTANTAANGDEVWVLRGGPDNLYPKRHTLATFEKLYKPDLVDFILDCIAAAKAVKQ